MTFLGDDTAIKIGTGWFHKIERLTPSGPRAVLTAKGSR